MKIFKETALSIIDEKRNDCWSKAVNNIDFTHSSWLAWNIINNLTGRSRNTRHLCPITVPYLAVGKNCAYKTTKRESARRVPTLEDSNTARKRCL